MNFNKLTDKDKDYIAVIYNSDLSHDEKIEILTNKYGVVGRTIRSWWAKLGLTGGGRDLPPQLKKAQERSIPKDTDILLVTSCQNKTVLNQEMFSKMLKYKEFIEEEVGKKVEIVVIPARYRNPVSAEGIEQYKKHEWWEQSIDEYLHYYKIEFGDTLIAADSRVRPTVQNPLRGYESLAGDGHLVMPSPRVHLKTLPRFKGDKLKVMCTTGYVSRRNYTKSGAGDKAYNHHVYGFTVVEKKEDGTCLPPRTVKCNTDGSFTDIIFRVDDSGVNIVNESEAFIWGDIHHAQIDEKFLPVTLDWVEKLNPQEHVLHDLLDSYSMNHHHKYDMFIQKLKIREGKSDIKKEVDSAIDFPINLAHLTGKRVNVVQSNHDDFLDKHVNRESWKKDLHNSEAYLEYAMIQQREDLRKHGNIFGYLVNSAGDGVVYIKGSDPLKVLDYQCGYHGDKGINGARGSINSFKRLNTKLVCGHSHSPGIKDGVTVVGVTCNIWQNYNSDGLSSWAYAHAIIHKTGKCQLLLFTDDYELTTLINEQI